MSKKANTNSNTYYLAKQAAVLIKKQKVHVMLLLFCYMVSFLLPMVVNAYCAEAYAPPIYAGDITLTIELNSYTEREQLLTRSELIKLLDAMDLSKGQQLNINVFTSSGTTVVYEGESIDCSVAYTYIPEDEKRLMHLISQDDLICGRLIKAPGECVVGNRMRGARSAEDILGKEIILSGVSYTIVGVADIRRLGVQAAMKPDLFVFFATMYIQYDGDNPRREANRLITAIEDEGLIVSSTSYATQMKLNSEEHINKSADFYAVFAWISYGFCFIATLSIISMIIYDNKRQVYIKLLLGATKRQIVTEYLFFFAAVCIAAGGLAPVFLRPLSLIFFSIGLDQLFSFSFDMLLLLLSMGLATSLMGAAYVAIKLRRSVV